MYLIQNPVNPDFQSSWGRLISSVRHLDALYGPANLAYYREYCGAFDVEDISRLVSYGATPLCGVRAFRCKLKTGKIEISCFGLPLFYFERFQAEPTELERAQRLLRKEFEIMLMAQPSGTIIRYEDKLLGGRMTRLGRLFLDLGAQATPKFSQIIDLSVSEVVLHSGLTKAYKWAVNWGKKNLVFKILDRSSITPEHIEQFRLLHFKAAGLETRTLKSWSLQFEMIISGEAFCVFASLDGILVSAGLFSNSKSHCFYGVSASRRDLFDKPISHGVIWSAMLYAKTLGIRYFEMGEQLFPIQNPSQKELGISYFKRSFGGELRVSLEVCLQLKAET